MNYNKGFKHVQKIAKNASPGREILQGIKHSGNRIISTDSHRLLSYKDDKVNFEDNVIHFKTGNEVEGVYPDIDKLLNNEDYKYEVTLTYEDIEYLRKIFKAGKTIKFDHVEIIKTKNDILFKLTTDNPISKINNIELTYQLSHETNNNEDEDTIILSLDYIIDLFDFLYETDKDTILKIDSNIKPIHFTGEDYTYLILPIRRY